MPSRSNTLSTCYSVGGRYTNTITIGGKVYQASDMSGIRIGPIYSEKGGSLPGISVVCGNGKGEQSFDIGEAALDLNEIRAFAKQNNIPVEEGSEI